MQIDRSIEISETNEGNRGPKNPQISNDVFSKVKQKEGRHFCKVRTFKTFS